MTKIAALAAHPKRSTPRSAIEAFQALGVPVEDLGTPKLYELRRRGGGTEVWFVFSGSPKFSVNMSVHRNHWPANFAAAREWMRKEYPGISEAVKPRAAGFGSPDK